MVDFLDVLYNPERIFKYRLEHNPYFPFKEVHPKVFVLRDASNWYIYELVGVTTLAAVYIAIVLTQGWSLQLLLIPLVGFVIVLPVIVRDSKKRTLVYDGNALIYEYYVGDELVYQGHCHNLYIRVKNETGDTEESHLYSLVVNGYALREYPITRHSRRREKLYRMGRRLAFNLNLNFFDSADKSTNHVIRHYCSFVERKASHPAEHKDV